MPAKNIKLIGSREDKEQNPLDFYPTPDYIIDALLKKEQFFGDIHEPCCGNGSIVRGLERHGCFNVTFSDVFFYDFRNYQCKDFLADEDQHTNIVTNPPYNLANEFMFHALRKTTWKVALLLPLRYLSGKKRYSIFREFNPSKIIIFPNKVDFLGAGNPCMEFCWIVWDKKWEGLPKIEWAEPLSNGQKSFTFD